MPDTDAPPPVATILAAAGFSPQLIHTLRNQPRPELGRLRAAKDALCAQLGSEAAAAEFLRLVGTQAGATPRLPLTGLLEYARAHALQFGEISAARTLQMPPTPVFGDPTREGFAATVRCVFH
ncbi:MAG: hypothetical protein ACREO3_11560, partial [Arenimonas sp.]